MTRSRLWYLGLGASVLLLGLALVIVLRPGLLVEVHYRPPKGLRIGPGELLPGGPTISVVNLFALFLVVGLVILAGFAIISLSDSAGQRLEVPSRSEGSTQQLTGEDLDDKIDALRRENVSTRQRIEYRQTLRTDVRDRAAVALTRIHDISHEEALDRLERGTWTNDRAAAAFLAAGRSPPLVVRVRDWLHPEPTFVRQLERAIEELHTELESDYGSA